MLTLLALAQGKRGLVRHIAAVIAGFALILVAAWFCFTQFLVFPPLIGALVAFGSAGVSGLAARSIGASVDLDRGIGRVLESLGGFGETPSSPDVMAESIVRLTGVTGALLLRSERVVGAYGYPGPRPGTVPNTANVPAGMLLTKIPWVAIPAEPRMAFWFFSTPH